MSFPRDSEYVGFTESRVLRECEDIEMILAERAELTRLARWEPADWQDYDPA